MPRRSRPVSALAQTAREVSTRMLTPPNVVQPNCSDEQSPSTRPTQASAPPHKPMPPYPKRCDAFAVGPLTPSPLFER